MDYIFGNATEIGLKIVLGTPTATMPAWLYYTDPSIANV
jgi:beta-galactosidase GanA